MLLVIMNGYRLMKLIKNFPLEEICHSVITIEYILVNYVRMLYTEFHTNGNWGYNVPVHPGQSLHKSQADNYHVNMCDMHTTSM